MDEIEHFPFVARPFMASPEHDESCSQCKLTVFSLHHTAKHKPTGNKISLKVGSDEGAKQGPADMSDASRVPIGFILSRVHQN